VNEISEYDKTLKKLKAISKESYCYDSIHICWKYYKNWI